ncbi:hypothetical protein D1872_354750 [compost metagenome]
MNVHVDHAWKHMESRRVPFLLCFALQFGGDCRNFSVFDPDIDFRDTVRQHHAAAAYDQIVTFHAHLSF